MAKELRFILEKGSKKYHCPQCNKKTFVRFIDEIESNYLQEQYGRCDRESKCGYFLAPPQETLCFFVAFDSFKIISEKALLIKQGSVEMLVPKKVVFEQLPTGLYIASYFLQDSKYKNVLKYNEIEQKFFTQEGKGVEITKPIIKTEISKPVFFDFETFKKTLKGYEQNTFIQNLVSRIDFPFHIDEITKVIQLYRLGTTSDGANTFPFIDVNGNVRAVQVKKFDEQNHTTKTDWLHSIIERKYLRNSKPLPEWLQKYIDQDKRVSCLFGEHLLKKYPKNPVALVEAPKTAIYGTLYFGVPENDKSLIWLAVYNKSSFSFDKIKALQGRTVLVFPDLSKDGSTFKEWETKVKEYQKQLKGTRFIFSDLLEQYANDDERNDGSDIADILIKQNWRLFRKSDPKQYTRKERVQIGLSIFKLNDLKELGREMFRENKVMSAKEIQNYLTDKQRLQGNDIYDLMDVLCIRKVIKAIDYPNYILN